MRFDAYALAHEGVRHRLIHLDGFEAPFSLRPEEHNAYARRFITLFMDEEGTCHGGNAQVMPVMNAWGERFALKTPVREGEQSRNALRREYELYRRLSGLKGFPSLYGRGLFEGAPVIVMEWIEGMPLSRARRQLAVDDEGRLSPLTAARIGRDLFDLLARMSVLEGEYAHRDVSPKNILIRTTRLPLQAQVLEGTFDLVLIDFGSAAQPGNGDAEGGASCFALQLNATLLRLDVRSCLRARKPKRRSTDPTKPLCRNRPRERKVLDGQ